MKKKESSGGKENKNEKKVKKVRKKIKISFPTADSMIEDKLVKIGKCNSHYRKKIKVSYPTADSMINKEEEETCRPDERLNQKDYINGENKRKPSEEPEIERPAKRLLIVVETLPTSEDASENNNSKPSEKSKMLGPISKRNIQGSVEKPKKKLLGPKSKRKSYEDSVKEDNLSKEHLKEEEVMDQKVQQVATKCNINLTSLFQSSLCRAGCGHCDEVGQYQIDSVDVDLTSQVVSMECTACRWTTVRQMTFTMKVVG